LGRQFEPFAGSVYAPILGIRTIRDTRDLQLAENLWQQASFDVSHLRRWRGLTHLELAQSRDVILAQFSLCGSEAGGPAEEISGLLSSDSY
jgi:hypothetical protein